MSAASCVPCSRRAWTSSDVTKLGRDSTVTVMEGRVEARHLKQLRMTLQQGADRREVVRLMQRREGHVLLEARHHAFAELPDEVVEGVTIDPRRRRDLP
jgi:hypothetical protein